MSSKHSFSVSTQIPSDGVEELLKAVFGADITNGISAQRIYCPTLVKVKSGDGIGFDIGDFVVVTNSKNNINMLMKANYEKPFEPYEELTFLDRPIKLEKDLVPGKTYMVCCDENFMFIKYLGSHTAITQRNNRLVTGKIPSHLPKSHYEVFASKSEQ